MTRSTIVKSVMGLIGAGIFVFVFQNCGGNSMNTSPVDGQSQSAVGPTEKVTPPANCLVNTKQSPKYVYEVWFDKPTYRLKGWVFDQHNPCVQVYGEFFLDNVKFANFAADLASTQLYNVVGDWSGNAFDIHIKKVNSTGQPRNVRFVNTAGQTVFQTTVTI